MAKNLKAMLAKKYSSAMSVDIINEVQFINTGIPTLNYVMSGKPLTGGLPLSGKMTVMYGGESSGKTSLVLHIIAKAQKEDIEVVYLDTERSITKPRLRQFGVNIDKMIYMTPETMEECFDIIESIAKDKEDAADNAPILIIWDSLAMTATKDEMERTSEEMEIASQARCLTRNLRRIRPKITRINAGLLLIQQARANQDRFGDIITFPGGYALQHSCDMIIRVSALKPDTDGLGFKFSTPKKNRLFRPFQSSVVRFLYSEGFTRNNIIDSFSEFLKQIGILGQSGAWCFLQSDVDKMIENGMDPKEAAKTAKKFYKSDFAERLINDPSYYDELLKTAEEYVSKNLIYVTKVMVDEDIDVEKAEKEAEEMERKDALFLGEEDINVQVLDPEGNAKDSEPDYSDLPPSGAPYHE